MMTSFLFSNKILICYFFKIIEPVSNARLVSPVRSTTPLFNGNGNTRPTSPASSSPLRHTVAVTNPNGTTVRSRDASRDREPLDYTDLEGNHFFIESPQYLLF